IAIAGGITVAVNLARQAVSHLQKIEVEVENFPQLHEALAARADAILLDNMTPEQTREAVRLVRETPGGEHLLLESSGGITLQTVHLYAEAGVDLISVGALTHSAPAVDISLEMTAEEEWAEAACSALDTMMPLQKRTDQDSRLFGLIEHEMMPSASNLSPLHTRTNLTHLLEEGWRQA